MARRGDMASGRVRVAGLMGKGRRRWVLLPLFCLQTETPFLSVGLLNFFFLITCGCVFFMCGFVGFFF